jgi:surfactin synthase thioesterase subunit
MTKIQAIFLHFAGGSKYSFQNFVAQVNDHVFNIVPLELPGRGARFKEDLLDDMSEIVNDVFGQCKKYLAAPYCLYGHSMGSVIGFLLTHKIIAEGYPPPLHLFFSGAAAPSTMVSKTARHTLSVDGLTTLLRDLGGVPNDILVDQELFKIFESVIRADFKAMDNYVYSHSDPLPVPITIMVGEEENISEKQALAWQLEVGGEFKFYKFPGNHFFIHKHHKDILQLMNLQLKQALNKTLN